jgi:hypothetical protein
MPDFESIKDSLCEGQARRANHLTDRLVGSKGELGVMNKDAGLSTETTWGLMAPRSWRLVGLNSSS